MNVYSTIICSASLPDVARRLHQLDHAGALDWLILSRGDLARRKLRAQTVGGHEVAVALPRSERLSDGAVLRLDADGALVVKVEAEQWLRIRPKDGKAALRLGFHAGNLHWTVRFDNGDMLVAVENPHATYLARLQLLLDDDLIRIVSDGVLNEQPC